MRIGDFLKTEVGKRFSDVLKGCDKRWECEYYNNLGEYTKILEENGWTSEMISEQLLWIKRDMYYVDEHDKDFVIVAN